MPPNCSPHPPGESMMIGLNRSKLQSIISLRITIPTHQIPISNIHGITLKLTAQQTWSAHPTRPLTLSARHTPLDTPIQNRAWTGGTGLNPHLQYKKDGKWKTKPARKVLPNFKNPSEEDWKAKLGFVTIPSCESGEASMVTYDVDLESVMGEDMRGVKIGDVVELRLCDARLARSPGVEWWNWGDLEGDLEGMKLGYLGDPKVNGKNGEEERRKIPRDLVLGFENWRDGEDEEGNRMVWLELEFGDDVVRLEVV